MSETFNIKTFARKKNEEEVWLKRLSFTSILVSSNLLQTMFTHSLDGLTSKQWLLLIVTSHAQGAPTLSEVGELMGCSRQNVKQIADILKKKGYLEFTKIEGDKNTVRLLPTGKWKQYCKENDEATSEILEKIFEGFSEELLKEYFKGFTMVMENIEWINQELKER